MSHIGNVNPCITDIMSWASPAIANLFWIGCFDFYMVPDVQSNRSHVCSGHLAAHGSMSHTTSYHIFGLSHPTSEGMFSEYISQWDS